ncbi:MAG: methionyl-tRNA formyltransferase [Clostridiaceae bacterium]|nr:methionyl-tRNA formyltransferase [Clostridiaceae bacterium]
MKILFMGTPDFAVPSLKALIDNNHEIIGVVTKVDSTRRGSRGLRNVPSPVKEYAQSKDIPVYQPVKLSKEPEMIEKIATLNPELIVTCAFGQLLPQSLLDIPKFGTINVHGSLLPKYRGAAPIQWAIINGDDKTGITTMFTELGLDTGDILLKEQISIDIDMTAGELHDIMSELGAKTLINTIKALEDGTLKRIKQDDNQATYAQKIDKQTGIINWNQTTLAIHNRIRGTNPWPGAQSMMCGKRFRICCSNIDDIPENINDKVNNPEILPGTILALESCDMWVKTGDGALLIHEIQAESCKRMTPQQYACGHELKPGMIFCEKETI